MAGIVKPIVTVLNTSTYTRIVMPAKLGGVTVYTEDGTSFYVATDSSGTGEALVPADIAVGWDRITPNANDSSAALYAKATVGTPNMVLLWAKS